ncbi:L,D-transpeptidase [Rhizobium sp. RAF56]|jgi:lipoprotein-anchoring transpeptidase ErfK/SrfK|uniref:L,D-transpeptidase n=1 Tax=Rhizobium sp. RAF56 TaxID=3233062 RepID=UPI003F9D04AF
MVQSFLSRRNFLAFAGFGAASALSGCASYPSYGGPVVQTVQYGDPAYNTFGGAQPIGGYYEQGYGGPQPDPAYMYAAMNDEGHELPAIPYQQIDPRYYRQHVPNPTGQPGGTVVVDPNNRFLYVVENNATAMRYGIGVGRQGFEWEGEGVIQWRQKWPRWNPPDEMVGRQPELVKYSIANGGMDPGLKNPLGARALYIFKDGQDTLYRLHGNPDWRSIGKAVSSGCIRLLNQDVIDLYNRVPNKARVVVL